MQMHSLISVPEEKDEQGGEEEEEEQFTQGKKAGEEDGRSHAWVVSGKTESRRSEAGGPLKNLGFFTSFPSTLFSSSYITFLEEEKTPLSCYGMYIICHARRYADTHIEE